MNLPPEKKKRKTKTKSSSPPPSLPPSYSLLPDEITINYLARTPRSYYPTLSMVCKSFHSIISSTELYAERSLIGSTEQCLYVCIWDSNHQFPQWFTLWDNPNRTLPNSSVTKKTKKTIGQLLVSIPPSNFPANIHSTIAVGSEIYLIGGPVNEVRSSSSVRILDCRSHTWRDAPSMNVSRRGALTCFYDGKIYVMGGCIGLENLWAEVFDIKTQTWERLPEPGTKVRMSCIYTIAEMEGKIKLGNWYAYDTKQGKWECCVNESATFPRSECGIENILYRYGSRGQSMCQWCDVKDENWKEVKGLDSLRNKYRRHGGSSDSIRKLVSYGGKLLLVWEVFERRNPIPNGLIKIWCAEIMLEKHSGDEVWGNVKWVDIVHTSTNPRSRLLHCLAVSV